MYKILALSIFFFCSVASTNAQKKINWLSWEEALDRHHNVKKKLMVDIYTDWSTICKQMEATTLSKTEIVDYINQNYYAVKFNAEDKKDIIFNNKLYKPIKSFGKRPTHELAIELTNGDVRYPTIVYVDENLKVIQPLIGFFGVRDLEMIMIYFAEDHYKTMSWKKYAKNFESPNFRKTTNPRDYQPSVQPAGGRK